MKYGYPGRVEEGGELWHIGLAVWKVASLSSESNPQKFLMHISADYYLFYEFHDVLEFVPRKLD